MFVNRTRGVVWATAGVLSLVGCTDPEQKTDLRPAGPPEVLSVLVMNDAAGGLYEGATFCKPGDNKRPSQVGTPDGNLLQVCPADQSMGVDELTDANPQNWYVRVMFDELLDPNIEELVPIIDSDGNDTGTFSGTIANTKPVKLQCQSISGNGLVDVPYDGYYNPSGNNVTWPLGPSLVIKPNFPSLVATDTECQVTINSNVTDKDGNPVPSDQVGPYKFKIAPIALITANTSPADGDSVDPIAAGVDVTFNTPIDLSSWTALVPGVVYDASNTFEFMPDPGNDYTLVESDTEFFVGADFAASAAYTWSIKEGAKLKDQCGKEHTFGAPSTDDGTQVSFMTNDLAFTGIAPFDGQMNVKPKDKIQLKFNQTMNPSTLATTEWSITPAVPGATAGYNGSFTLIIDGELKPSTMYTFTLKNGATIDDCPGAEWFGTPPTCHSMKSATFTNADGDQVVHFTTAALALSSTSPADNGTFTLDSSGKLVIDLTFNFDVDPSTLAATEYAFSGSGITFTAGYGSAANVLELTSNQTVAPGDYTFTLKMGATIDDLEATPSTYTQAADQVIHLTVDPAPTPTPTTTTPCY
jgi:hypothetical protein